MAAGLKEWANDVGLVARQALPISGMIANAMIDGLMIVNLIAGHSSAMIASRMIVRAEGSGRLNLPVLLGVFRVRVLKASGMVSARIQVNETFLNAILARGILANAAPPSPTQEKVATASVAGDRIPVALPARLLVPLLVASPVFKAL